MHIWKLSELFLSEKISNKEKYFVLEIETQFRLTFLRTSVFLQKSKSNVEFLFRIKIFIELGIPLSWQEINIVLYVYV